jgi:hypothetical protein
MFGSPNREPREPRSPIPWIVAGVVVVVVVGLLVALGRHRAPVNPGGAGMAAADPYAANLAIANLQMSQAGNMAGGQTTYIDGQVTNKGSETVTGITVQVGFIGFTGQLVGKPAMTLTLIRTREPYVDTEPVSAAPILPGQSRDFRLIFDSMPPDWNQNYPEVRVIQVAGK